MQELIIWKTGPSESMH